jgi:integrase
MKLPRGVRTVEGRLFARLYAKGGEYSFALGPASDPEQAVQRFYAIRAHLRSGIAPEEIKAALRTKRGLGLFPEPPNGTGSEASITVAEAARRWIAERVRLDLEAKNATDTERRLEACLVPFLGSKPLREVRRADCHAFKGHIRATRPGLKPGTLIHYLRTLRELLTWAEDVELISESPWPRKRIMPRIEKHPPDRLTDEEVAILVALPEPWGFGLRLGIGTGLRWGELVRLRRGDLQSDGVLLIREAKDGEPRTVPVPPGLLEEIMQRRGALLTNRKGRPYSETSNGAFNATIRRQAAKVLKALPTAERRELGGLARFHIHMTRHSFACRYLESGGELAMLQEILGHESVTTTQRYGEPNKKAIRADAARVFAAQEAFFRSGPEKALGRASR